MRHLALAVLCIQAVFSAGQQISNDQFNLTYSQAGLSSVKHTNDTYDTDYIAPGRSLGDVLVRYRAAGDGAWREASSATAPVASNETLSYTVSRAAPTLATSSKASASSGQWSLHALNDQIEPTNAGDKDIPFFRWDDHKGTREWVQYDFDGPKQVSFAEINWAEGAEGDQKWAPPVSWVLQYRDGDDWKIVHTTDIYGRAAGKFNRVTFEPVTTSALRLEAQLPRDASSGIYEWRVNTSEGKQVEGVQEIQPSVTFRLNGNALEWIIKLHNRSDNPVEIGDLGIPLPFNTQYVWDRTTTYTKRLIRHSFIGGSGSYIFWMRSNAAGPYLVMVPEKGTQLEYFDQHRGETFRAYIHSSASRAELTAKGGKWRLPPTHVILAPKGQPGDSARYGFRFRWAKDYDAVREILYDEGGLDVTVVPGMTVPNNLAAMFSLHTRNRILGIDAEYPDRTTIRSAGKPGKDLHIYAVKFSKLGENMLKVRYGDGQYLSLDFFVTEPLETLIRKRAAFLVTHEQWNDPKRWYNGLYSQWDMKHQILRSPDDLDGLQSYAVACDDTALGKAPYLAAKNIFFPEQKEVDSIESYIRNYVWGGLQQTEKEPYPYSVYGIPNWKVNRESPDDDRRGKKHVWRIYDYPHLTLLYYNMYVIAKDYPGMVHYLDKAGYLDRAYRTAMAFFTVPAEIIQWSAYETGTYNELVIPDLIRALDENGSEDAARLRAHWEIKAKHFINDHPDLYASEYPFDSTAFESTHALAKYAMERLNDPAGAEFARTVKRDDAQQFLEEQMTLNLACRGTDPAYYWLGSDFRGSGSASYTLSYMAQMGGWAVQDYALNFARDPVPYLRLGYASYLSSWALMNSGTAESNYGYWFPGKENDGGAGGGFEPRPWGIAWLGNKEMGRGSWWYSGEIDLGFSGALRMAATIVSEDPIFGLFAYGGELKRAKDSIQVIPKDGLRARFAIVRPDVRFQMDLDRDGFASNRAVRFNHSLSRIDFVLENRSHDAHQTDLEVRGLPAGTYKVLLNQASLASFSVKAGESHNVKLALAANGASLTILRD
jgi:Family of unknown function (DUF5695)